MTTTTIAARVRCLHCGHRPAATPRNLCRTCVAVRSVRDRFPLPDHLRCRHCGVRKANGRHGLCTRCCGDRAVVAAHKAPDGGSWKGKPCRRCGAAPAGRPRGLCWGCYYTPGVKEAYPPTSRYASRGVGGDRTLAPPPAEPTDAAPGSEAKIGVLAARAARGESLWHPSDAGGDVSVLGILRAIREGAA